jgi:hypothetical protein
LPRPRPRLVFFAALLCVAGNATAVDKAELVKAAMVEKISRFIEWPRAPAGKFLLCVAPDHPQLEAVRAYYESAVIADRPVEVLLLKRSEALAGCQVAFLAPRDLGDMARVRANADRDHVLLVAEGADAARSGAHVAFYSDMNRLRLEVNRKALEASGLKASFRLLEVAKVVE